VGDPFNAFCSACNGPPKCNGSNFSRAYTSDALEVGVRFRGSRVRGSRVGGSRIRGSRVRGSRVRARVRGVRV
jgi:hypothetical protein